MNTDKQQEKADELGYSSVEHMIADRPMIMEDMEDLMVKALTMKEVLRAITLGATDDQIKEICPAKVLVESLVVYSASVVRELALRK